MNPNRVRHIAQIGYHTYADTVRLDAEAHRVGGIVRNRERVNLNVADAKFARAFDLDGLVLKSGAAF